MENKVIIHNESELIEFIRDNQTSMQKVLNNRAYIKGIGWGEVQFSYEIKKLLIDKAVNVIGGRNSLKVRRFLNNGTYQHWALDRLFITCYNNVINVDYCAGQDYVWELNNLRQYIYKVV